MELTLKLKKNIILKVQKIKQNISIKKYLMKKIKEEIYARIYI